MNTNNINSKLKFKFKNFLTNEKINYSFCVFFVSKIYQF